MMTKKIELTFIIFFLCSLLIPNPVRGDDRSSAEKMFQEAENLNKGMASCSSDILLQKEFFYKQAIILYPAYAAAHNNLADVYENLGRYEEAIREYTLAKDIEPKSEYPYFGLGDIYSKTGRYSEAIKWYEKGLVINPKDEAALQKINEAKSILGQEIIPSVTIASILGRRTTRSTGGVSNISSISFKESRLQFSFDSAEILPESYPQLNEIGKALTRQDLSEISVRLAGNTDSRGTREYNKVLSVKRAESVKKYLVNQFGISPKRLITVGYGKDRLISTGTDEESHSLNRRVEIARFEKEDVAGLISPKKLSAEVGFFYKNKEGKFSRIHDGMTLSSKSNYKIFFKSDKDCWVYAYKKDSSGKIDLLFPKPGSSGTVNPVKAGKEYWSPTPSEWFNLEGPAGQERIYVVAVNERARDLEHLLSSGKSVSAEGKNAEEVVCQIKTRGMGQPRTSSTKFKASKESIVGDDGFYTELKFIHK
jgi:outer membrane protein OmpA-like peptidoglycan-associated protein